jgi:8-oxo-dGTP pyrophosphatase MutT (NUDIX family)/phosphohistidine phosphatase SixA
MPSSPDVVAAGAVVLRRSPTGKSREVLLVHRPKYDDWSFPKGKLDRGEHLLAAAVREVAEETGLAVRLGRPLKSQRYPVAGGRMKTVHYWVARTIDGDDTTTYSPNEEIDQVLWVPFDQADALLTYPHDQRTLAEAVRKRRRTSTVVVLRHAQARSRSHWRTDDRFRPLLKVGSLQADRLVPLLAAYDPTRLVSSSSARCVSTIVPYADSCGRKIAVEDGLSEEDATRERVTELVQELVEAGRRTVLCTHRPVLPIVFDVLGAEDPKLEPGEMVVVHHRRGEVVALERFQVR